MLGRWLTSSASSRFWLSTLCILVRRPWWSILLKSLTTPNGREHADNKKQPALKSCFQKPAAVFTSTLRCFVSLLRLNDTWRNEEDQLRIGVLTVVCLNRLPRNGILPNNGTCAMLIELLVLDDAADHHRAAIGHTYLRGRLLGDQAWIAVNGVTEIPVLCSPTSTFKKIVFSDVICGTTVSRKERVHVRSRSVGRPNCRQGHDGYASTFASQPPGYCSGSPHADRDRILSKRETPAIVKMASSRTVPLAG